MAIIVGGFLGLKFSSWFFFSLILIFLGGIMVIFLYFSGLSVSEKINFKFKKLELFVFLFFLGVNLNVVSLFEENFLKLLRLNFNKLNLILNMFFIFYLLFALFLVVKFSESFKGRIESLKF
jgi:Zn-dependent protease with chaperone function